jgi:hypothetical protein
MSTLAPVEYVYTRSCRISLYSLLQNKFILAPVDTGGLEPVEDGEEDVRCHGCAQDVRQVDRHKLRPVGVVLLSVKIKIIYHYHHTFRTKCSPRRWLVFPVTVCKNKIYIYFFLSNSIVVYAL